jgi:hypothetical protein
MGLMDKKNLPKFEKVLQQQSFGNMIVGLGGGGMLILYIKVTKARTCVLAIIQYGE